MAKIARSTACRWNHPADPGLDLLLIEHHLMHRSGGVFLVDARLLEHILDGQIGNEERQASQNDKGPGWKVFQEVHCSVLFNIFMVKYSYIYIT